MVIYLPCKLGEEFTERKFKEWVNGERVYIDGHKRKLVGFTNGLFHPDYFTEDVIIEYDPSGKWGQGFIAKYKISVPIGQTGKLSEMGFPGNRKAKLYGLCIKGGMTMAEFITTDRYEHLYYPIEDQLQYSLVDEEAVETEIKYCKVKQNNKQMTVFDVM